MRTATMENDSDWQVREEFQCLVKSLSGFLVLTMDACLKVTWAAGVNHLIWKQAVLPGCLFPQSPSKPMLNKWLYWQKKKKRKKYPLRNMVCSCVYFWKVFSISMSLTLWSFSILRRIYSMTVHSCSDKDCCLNTSHWLNSWLHLHMICIWIWKREF